MNNSLNKGLSFGLTSGIITTLGLIVGLNAGTHSKVAVIGGILTVAIADAFSDALGIHISEESQNNISNKSIWEATLATLISKFIFASTFVVPFLIFELSQAVLISVIWGFLVLSIFNYFLARKKGKNQWNIILEHLAIGLLVVLITYFVGNWIAAVFS